MSPRRFGCGLLGCLALLACAPADDGPGRLENYLTRLGRAIDYPLPEAPWLAPPRIIDADLALIPTTPSEIGVLDFLSLSGCELQINLGRRNSSLGRNASPSQRLLLDLEFLRLAPACAKYLDSEGEEALATTLTDVSQQRKAELPQRIYNALLAGPEFQKFWRLPPGLGNYPENVSGDVVDSLTWLSAQTQAWLAGDFEADGAALEYHLSQLRSGDGGDLLLAAAASGRNLDRASRGLIARAESRPLCPSGGLSETARITQTVVAKFFAGDVQPWLARLSQRQFALMAPIAIIENTLMSVLPNNYQRWRGDRDTLLAHLQTAPRDHVAAVKTAFEGCHGTRWGGA